MDVWSLKQIRKWQVADDEINNILHFKSVSQYPPTSPEVVGKEFRSYLNQWDLLSVENSVLYRHWYEHDSDCESWVIVAPKQLRRELFHHLLELHTGGHLGIKRTVYQLQRRFYWPGLQSDVGGGSGGFTRPIPGDGGADQLRGISRTGPEVQK